MKKVLTTLVVVGLVVAGLAVEYRTGHSEVMAPLFVVYGIMTCGSNPIEGTYTVVIENLRTGVTVRGDVGEGEDAGKYAAVFIDYYGGNAVAAGDSISLSLEMDSVPVNGLSERYEVSADNVLDMRMLIDIILEPPTPVDSKTWGAIKSLYR